MATLIFHEVGARISLIRRRRNVGATAAAVVLIATCVIFAALTVRASASPERITVETIQPVGAQGQRFVHGSYQLEFDETRVHFTGFPLNASSGKRRVTAYLDAHHCETGGNVDAPDNTGFSYSLKPSVCEGFPQTGRAEIRCNGSNPRTEPYQIRRLSQAPLSTVDIFRLDAMGASIVLTNFYAHQWGQVALMPPEGPMSLVTLALTGGASPPVTIAAILFSGTDACKTPIPLQRRYDSPLPGNG